MMTSSIACCSALFRKLEKCLLTICSMDSSVYTSLRLRKRSSVLLYILLYSSFVGSMAFIVCLCENILFNFFRLS